MNTSASRSILAVLLPFASALTLAACASAPAPHSYHAYSEGTRKPYVEYDSGSLLMLNSEQMNALVMKKIKKAQEIQKKQEVNDDEGLAAEPAAVDQLKDATRIVFARPDQDGSREHTFVRLRRELTDLNALDSVLRDLSAESINALRDGSPNSAREQATYIVVLENLMAEIKPEVSTNPAFKKIVEGIRDADIEIPDKVRSQQLLRSMNKPVSPSETAAKIVPKKK